MTAPKHSHFGGSNAGRLMNCPGSAREIEKVPDYLRKTSTAWADAGTAKHAVMAQLLDESGQHLPEDFVGKTIGEYTVTEDDVILFLRPAFDHAVALIEAPGARYCLEKRVKFPTVADAFGTLDLAVQIDRTVHIDDLKFGTGVKVAAQYPDGTINSQLQFYAAALRHTLPDFFDGVDDIVLTIVQPVSTDLDAEPVSSVTVSHAELDKFIEAYRAACEEALSPSPRLAKGAHCRFCPARPICPAHTKPLLDLAQFELPRLGAATIALSGPEAKERYLAALAHGLDLVDAVKDLSTALKEQARRALELGDTVPGFALSAGRAERHWRDAEPEAIAALIGLGLSRSDVVEETIRSPKQAELRARARKIKIPSEFIISRRSGTSLVRSENAHAPVPGRSELARSFTEALEAFQGGRQS